MLPYIWQNEDKCYSSSSATLVNGTSIFSVTGGPILIKSIVSVCETANGAALTTLQWQCAPTVGTATTISGATASLANATAGTTIRLNNLSLAASPSVVAASAGGVQIGQSVPNEILVPAGMIKSVVASGPSTGTWTHYLRYTPMGPDSIVNGVA